ncbi:MAG: translation elongation factor Ts [Alphaproteobacteria bacterium]
MPAVSASIVKTLREKTGAGMLDCKKALNECDGDIEKSIDWLRKKGLNTAAKKSSRVAAEGLVGAMLNKEMNAGVMIEINAETDFVARNDMFQKLFDSGLDIAMQYGDDNEKIKNHLTSAMTDLIATIGENINFRRVKKLTVKHGIIANYIHNALKPHLGKIGVLVALESNGDKNKLQDLGKKLAMHITAQNPQYISINLVPNNIIEHEKSIFREQAMAAKKPDAVIEKMIEGQMKKFYEEAVLQEQIFIFDGETKINAVLKDAEKTIGAPIQIKDFILFRLGEGIEKKQDNFASEVDAMTKN